MKNYESGRLNKNSK